MKLVEDEVRGDDGVECSFSCLAGSFMYDLELCAKLGGCFGYVDSVEHLFSELVADW